ncbi:uncharacterized protein LOC126982945 [Eriocheir sinensis]|uniref:uncharacterized protein LOC126982945 n=1 Tax=Eriocheir sinensis TaxID=95602 RepID=UPI0021C934AC|nr:uncharacterized protein LOC126982945 [Eriocheir sinensis]
MRVIMLVVAAACVAACAAQRELPLPTLTDRERQQFLENIDLAVDCIIQPKKGCHRYSYDVRRLMPELISNGFECNCEAQKDVNLFKQELQKRANKKAFRRLALWVNTEAALQS